MWEKKEAEALKDCNQLFINKLINFSLASGTIHVHEIKLYWQENKKAMKSNCLGLDNAPQPWITQDSIKKKKADGMENHNNDFFQSFLWG